MFEFLIKQIYINKQIVKYVISGGTAAFVDLLLLFLLTDIFGLWYIYSATLAFLVAIFISFYLQKNWTFRDKDKKVGRQMIMYFAVGGTNLIINAGGMYFFVDRFALNYILAQILMGVFIGMSSFIIYRLFIFRKKRKLKKREEIEGGKKLRVLIATGIFPPDIGGPATMLKPLIDLLIREGIKVKVITYANKGGKAWLECGSKEVKVYKINRQNNFFKYFFYLRRFLELAKWSDVIYATDTYSVGYFSYLVKKILNKKYIIRFVGDSAWETSASKGWIDDYIVDFQNNRYNKKIEKLKEKNRKILKNADKIIAVSYFVADLAKNIGVKKEKIKVIYNSVDFLDKVEINQDEVEEIKFKYGNNAKIIVTSCRLTPWKGVDGVIKILPELKKQVGDINFLVLGDGPEMENLKNLVKEYNVEKNVHFLGRVRHEETIKYFKAADLYILNSNYEGFSHALLDVMKSGAPIITTNVGGNPELINGDKEGVLINYNNEKELFDACVKILIDKKFAESLSANAREKVKKFKWENTVNETIKLLREFKSN